MKRVLVDMSATLIHHGHVRLLKQAKKHGYVIVALTTDDEIEKKKGYAPEIAFDNRKEILEAFRYVDEVVASPWLIDQAFLDRHRIDLLVHGDDNSNQIEKNKLIIFPRTTGISSTLLRQRAKKILEGGLDE
jgi:glycerol-3-phosphate cytidylyltransferase